MLQRNACASPLAGTELNTGGTLGGYGELGEVQALGGIVAPGSESPGTLTVGSMTMSPSATLRLRLNDQEDSDLLRVWRGLDLGGARLSVALGSIPPWGKVYRIIETTNSGGVGGNFAGLAQGSILDVNGTQLQIDYHAGSSTAVELTVVSRPLVVASLECLSDGSKQLLVAGNANANFVIEATTNLLDWTPLRTNRLDAAGQFQFTDADAPLPALRVYRAREQ